MYPGYVGVEREYVGIQPGYAGMKQGIYGGCLDVREKFVTCHEEVYNTAALRLIMLDVMWYEKYKLYCERRSKILSRTFPSLHDPFH